MLLYFLALVLFLNLTSFHIDIASVPVSKNSVTASVFGSLSIYLAHCLASSGFLKIVGRINMINSVRYVIS